MGANTSVRVRTVLFNVKDPRFLSGGVPWPTSAGWETVGAVTTVTTVAVEGGIGYSIIVFTY